MSVAWTSFTPLESFLGGCLIGLSAFLLMAFKGRIMGMSGILADVVAHTGTGERSWRLMFLGGAILGPMIWQLIAGNTSNGKPFQRATILHCRVTRWGRNCDRVRLYLGSRDMRACPNVATLAGSCAGVYGQCDCDRGIDQVGLTEHPMGRLIVAFVSGLIFGIGLALAGMLNPAKVVGFLDIFGLWDPSLALVMVGGIAVNLIGLRFVLKRPTPILCDRFLLANGKRD